MKYLNGNSMNDFCIEMFLQLISIPDFVSKIRTISVKPYSDERIKGVALIIRFQYHKLFKTEI